MNPVPFKLTPFPDGLPLQEGIFVSGSLHRDDHSLTLSFELRTPPEAVDVPPPAQLPLRKTGLWESTCCECFIAPQGEPGYLEFNLSPAGHWDVFRFSAYREGMRREESFQTLPFVVTRLEAGVLTLQLRIDTGHLFPGAERFDIGLTAVIRLKNGSISYWALVHPGPRPDFHLREGFGISL